MTDGSAQQLQYPVELDPDYVTELMRARLNLLRYEEQESRPDYFLFTDLAIMYNTCVLLIQRLNALIETPPHDLARLAQVVSDIRVALGPALVHYIGTSEQSLGHLMDHITELEAKTEH